MAKLDREQIRQIEIMVKPLATRIANGAARAVVELTDDGPKLQLLQVGVLEGETIDDAEHFQPYGFSSVPLGGAEAVIIFPGGDRSHPLVVAVSDRRHRPTAGEPGEVTVYNHTGANIRITKDGDIIGEPAAGREFLVRQDGGTPLKLLTELDAGILKTALATAAIAVGANGAAAVVAAMDAEVAALVPPVVPPTWPVGTKTLKGE